MRAPERNRGAFYAASGTFFPHEIFFCEIPPTRKMSKSEVTRKNVSTDWNWGLSRHVEVPMLDLHPTPPICSTSRVPANFLPGCSEEILSLTSSRESSKLDLEFGQRVSSGTCFRWWNRSWNSRSFDLWSSHWPHPCWEWLNRQVMLGVVWLFSSDCQKGAIKML